MKAYFVLAVLLISMVSEQVWGMNGHLCKKDDHCNVEAGQRCQKLDKCKWGECVCKQGWAWNGGGYGACSQLRLVGETCNDGSQYCTGSSSVECTSGTCSCKGSLVPNAAKTGCVSSTATTTACKKDGESCTSTSNCCRGATCTDSKCKCRDHTVWWEAGGQCIHEKSVNNIEQDDRCSTQYAYNGMIYSTAQKFCAKGLVCRSCPEDDSSSPLRSGRKFCAKSAINSAPVSQMSLFALLIPVIASLWA